MGEMTSGGHATRLIPLDRVPIATLWPKTAFQSPASDCSAANLRFADFGKEWPYVSLFDVMRLLSRTNDTALLGLNKRSMYLSGFTAFGDPAGSNFRRDPAEYLAEGPPDEADTIAVTGRGRGTLFTNAYLRGDVAAQLKGLVLPFVEALGLRSAAAAEKSKLPEVANLQQWNETLTAELADARQRITALEAQIADFESLDYVSEDEVREIRPKKKRRVDTQYVKVKRENEEQSAALETARLALGCAICQDVLEAPVSLPCGHAFCFDCIHLHFNSGDVYSRKCPTCRAIMPPRTRRRTFNKNATLAAVVGAITERQNAPGA